ncbi:MAG: hypothetical protein JXQ90_15480 [Cyclobacteriaceae bacterium]
MTEQLRLLSTITIICLVITSATAFATDLKDKKTTSVTRIELEEMSLTSAEIVKAMDASKGEAIKMLSANASATTQLTLPAGQYVLNAVFSTEDEFSDGFYLVANDKVQRTNNYHFNKWVYGFKFLVFDSDGETPITLTIASSWKNEKGKEFGMVIDYLEIAELCNSAEILERWIK